MKTVGIFMFNEVEVLDFAGAFEVFSLAEDEHRDKLFKVITIAQTPDIIHARNGLQIKPDYQFDNHPTLDVLVIPGGYGAEKIEINNATALGWIAKNHAQVSQTLSICTGAFLLAEIGVLDGKMATTHWMDLPLFAKEYPQIDVVANRRYVDAGDVITSAGISSGIQASLYTVSKLTSKQIANATAKRMEFDFYLD
ncbi:MULTISPECIES: DJ-1/PfpI family protein [unclassified Moraxella]|uniref:DJ-1/PfpI family protein n=1 Tax=unclassified Moraxella TaxID=2685852 RepID=UPI003AF76F4C